MNKPSTYANPVSRYKFGKFGAKREKKSFKDNIRRISKPDIRRLARRDVYDEARAAMKSFLENIIRSAVMYCDHANRRTITSLDIVHAVKLHKRVLYGYGH
ncbi:histone-fold-containing protein [Colletotrichum godetiae]|uniref:Histone H4 n=1 Tax=Colletotrichum godetiae TaxID=1209918 RepID=A0AAJ0A621_9PEZI|nr:histone-fold-containing protein [Colletotrichum godetiae]KAK1656759.1 histone-fold-containing protein [Colletotrichum godetiae]